MEEDQRMILAGDIGATNSRLAFFSERGGRLEPVVEATYPSRDHANLETIVKKFVSAYDLPIDVACLGGGPVRHGRSDTT
jgi:glucokinase